MQRVVTKDAVVPRFVRIRQRRARNCSTKSGAIQLARLRSQTGDHITQAPAKGQLGEEHAQQLGPMSQRLGGSPAVIPLHASRELTPRQEVRELCKHQSVVAHANPAQKERVWRRTPKSTTKSFSLSLTEISSSDSYLATM